MNKTSDVIFALTGPLARSALHLHRVSGPRCMELLEPYLFYPATKKKFFVAHLKLQKHPQTRYLEILDLQGHCIDDGCLTFFPAPYSFTGEEIVECSLHGNPIIAAQFHSLLRHLGFLDAAPGEFTSRAVLYGKVDLAQAEGINQLILAETQGAVTLARNNAQGVLSQELKQLRQDLIHILSFFEAHVDFSSEDVGPYNPQDILPQLSNIEKQFKLLLDSYSSGLKMRQGVCLVLCGRPNAGKSTLYNSLLRYERAIVTSIPGTTRDTLEDKLLICEKDFVILDTAGYRLTQDPLEALGVQRTKQALPRADLICYIVDGSSFYDCLNIEEALVQEIENFYKEMNVSKEKKILLVINKEDLVLEKSRIPKFINTGQSNILQILFTSQHHIQDLENYLSDFYDELTKFKGIREHPILISERQRDKVKCALENLLHSKELVIKNDYPEKIASELNLAKISVGEILGEVVLDDVFDNLFSSFCIGK